MKFHLMCVHIIFSSVWVVVWPSFGKELLTRLTIYSLCSLTICNFSFGFEDWIWFSLLQFLVFAYFFTFRL